MTPPIATELAQLLHRRIATGRVTPLGRNLIPYGMAGYYGIDMINGYTGINLEEIDLDAVLKSDFSSLEGVTDDAIKFGKIINRNGSKHCEPKLASAQIKFH